MHPKPQKITICIADDHTVVRKGIHHILAEVADISIVGEARDGEEVKKLVARLQPRILLLDLRMPGMSPFEIEKWVREHYPETVTLVLTAHDRDFYLAGMMEAGVAGYLQKTDRVDNLIAAIRRAAQGEAIFTVEQIDRARKWRQEVGEIWKKLTEQEREILSLVAHGQDNKTIAKSLGLSPKTIAYHISKLLNRLNVESRSAAVAWLRRYFPDDLE